MKIAVCVKAVPDTESKIAIAADKKGVDYTGVRFVTSPYDEFAIEAALLLKEKHGGETVVISMGGAECTDGSETLWLVASTLLFTCKIQRSLVWNH